MTSTASASVSVPADEMSGALRQTAAGMGMSLYEDGGAIALRLQLGSMEMVPEASGVRLEFSAANDAKLQLLRDTIAERLVAVAPDLQLRWSAGVTPGAVPANVSLLDVESITRISPSFYRVRLVGNVTRFLAEEAGLHFKLLFGPDGTLSPVLDDDGLTEWPGGVAAWHRPSYTTRAIDPAGQWLDFDVFIHDGGRTTRWCETTQPGTRIALAGPGGGTVAAAGWLGLVGDETALPVLARALESAAPDTKGTAVIFVPDLADAQPINVPVGVTLRWVLRGSQETPLSALQAMTIPATDRFVFFAAEKAESKAARAWLTEQGLVKAEQRCAAYWTA